MNISILRRIISYYVVFRYLNLAAKLPSLPKVIFVLGCPGAGKGTQSEKLAEEFNFKHICAGDLLREERNKPDSKFGELIETHIRNGTIVPPEITCKLINKTIQSSTNTNVFVIDGFPRNVNNLQGWYREMGDKTDLQLLLFFDCPDDVCVQRCLKRGAAGSGRSDDNIESIRKRLVTFHRDTSQIITYYGLKNLVKKIDSTRTRDEIFKEVKTLVAYLGS